MLFTSCAKKPDIENGNSKMEFHVGGHNRVQSRRFDAKLFHHDTLPQFNNFIQIIFHTTETRKIAGDVGSGVRECFKNITKYHDVMFKFSRGPKVESVL